MRQLIGSAALSPFALDLAISKVAEAAVRLKSDQALTGDDVSWAAQLRKDLSALSSESKPSGEIPVGIVPRNEMREQLEQMLASTRSKLKGRIPDKALLAETVSLLDKMVEREIGKDHASRLIDVLIALDHQQPQADDLSGIEL